MNANDEQKEIFLSSIKESGKNFKYFKNIPIELRKELDFIIEILKALKENEAYVGHYEDSASEIIKDLTIDKEVALKLVNYHGYLICKLPKEFKDDEDIIISAIHSYPYSLVYCSKEAKDNKKIVLEAVKVRGDNLESASKRLWADKEVVLEAVKNDGKAITYAPYLWNNREIMLEAAKNNKHVLQFLTGDLIGDKEISLAAYKGDKYAYEYFSKDLKKEIIDKNIEDIASYLESVILAEQLQKEMSESNLQIKKIKI